MAAFDTILELADKIEDGDLKTNLQKYVKELMLYGTMAA